MLLFVRIKQAFLRHDSQPYTCPLDLLRQSIRASTYAGTPPHTLVEASRGNLKTATFKTWLQKLNLHHRKETQRRSQEMIVFTICDISNIQFPIYSVDKQPTFSTTHLPHLIPTLNVKPCRAAWIPDSGSRTFAGLRAVFFRFRSGTPDIKRSQLQRRTYSPKEE